jgi:hypothetical protein
VKRLLAAVVVVVLGVAVVIVLVVRHDKSSTPPAVAAGLVRLVGGSHSAGVPPPPSAIGPSAVATAAGISGKGSDATARLAMVIKGKAYGPFPVVVGQVVTQGGVRLRVVHIWPESKAYNSAVDVQVLNS